MSLISRKLMFLVNTVTQKEYMVEASYLLHLWQLIKLDLLCALLQIYTTLTVC